MPDQQSLMQQAQNELDNAKRLGQDTTAAVKRLAAAQRAEAEARAAAKQTAEVAAAEEAARKAAKEGSPMEEEPAKGESKLSAQRTAVPQGRSSKPVQKG